MFFYWLMIPDFCLKLALMLYSMTGFGRAEGVVNECQIVAEIKSLNGKQFELNMKLPPLLRSYDLDIRNQLNSVLIRGSIDFNILIRQGGASKPMSVNTELALFYYKGIKQIAESLNVPEENILSTLMRMPEVVAPESDVWPEEAFEPMLEIIKEAANRLMEHRKQEGASLEKDLSEKIKNIEALLQKILPLEPQRIEKIKVRIENMLNASVGQESVDANRFEQELIYYIERMDFSEEKVRLQQHCTYFLSMLQNPEFSKGKKLGFTLQEIGREINTLGAKANDARIQQIVISMKDELEKAKEQVLNVL